MESNGCFFIVIPCAKMQQTSEIDKACFDKFYSECRKSSSKNSKMQQTSEIGKACFDKFYSECRLYSRFIANEQQTSEIGKACFDKFTASAGYIRDLSQIDTNTLCLGQMKAKKIKKTPIIFKRRII